MRLSILASQLAAFSGRHGQNKRPPEENRPGSKQPKPLGIAVSALLVLPVAAAILLSGSTAGVKLILLMLLGLLVGFVYIVIERRLVKYTLKRLLGSALTLFIIVAVVFILLRQMPIEGYFDNFDKLNETQVNVKLKQLGLTQPIYKQFWDFLVKLFHGDLGSSTRYSAGTPITSIIAKKAPISIYIGLMSMALSLVLGIPLGAAMARSKSGFWDRFGTVFIVLINAVPAAVYYIFIQMYGTSWMGISMLFDKNNWVTWILPVFSMSLGSIASYAMWLRRYMLDEINKDYIRLARAKGVPSRRLMFRHVFRNAFVPMIQYIPASLLYTVCGSIYIESLYSIPGMGGLLVDVIGRQDNPMVQALVMIYSCIGIIGLLLGDLLMAVIDPRISFVKKEGVR